MKVFAQKHHISRIFKQHTQGKVSFPLFLNVWVVFSFLVSLNLFEFYMSNQIVPSMAYIIQTESISVIFGDLWIYVYAMLHVSAMDHLRNDRPSMAASSRREWYARNEVERRVVRGRHANGFGPSQMNEPKQLDMEEEEVVEVENMDDDEHSQKDMEVEPQLCDDYLGDPHDVYVLAQYHIHVTYRTSEGIVRVYNFNFLYYVFYVNRRLFLFYLCKLN